MKSLIGSAAAGVTVSSLIVTIGITATAWIVLVVCVAVIVAGAVDYARNHG